MDLNTLSNIQLAVPVLSVVFFIGVGLDLSPPKVVRASFWISVFLSVISLVSYIYYEHLFDFLAFGKSYNIRIDLLILWIAFAITIFFSVSSAVLYLRKINKTN